MNDAKADRRRRVLKAVFLFGAFADALLALEWYLISLGVIDMPIHPSFFQGSGEDYRFVLSTAALLVLGWAGVLYWGSLRPLQRSGLFLLTAFMLFVAILSDALIFGHLFTATQVGLGTTAKLFLVVLFAGSYWYSRQSATAT